MLRLCQGNWVLRAPKITWLELADGDVHEAYPGNPPGAQ